MTYYRVSFSFFCVDRRGLTKKLAMVRWMDQDRNKGGKGVASNNEDDDENGDMMRLASSPLTRLHLVENDMRGFLGEIKSR